MFQSYAAFISFCHFFYIVFKAAQGSNFIICNNNAVAYNTDQRVTYNFSVCYVRAHNNTNIADFINLAAFRTAVEQLAVFWSQHTFHRSLNIFNCFINNAIQVKVNAVTFCIFFRNRVRTDIKADDNCIRSTCKHYVRFADSTNTAMNDSYAHFIVTQFFQRLFYRFKRALNIGFYNDLQFFHLAFLHLVKQVIQSYFCLCIEAFFFLLRTALFYQLTTQTFIRNRVENIAACRYVVQTCDFYRNRWSCRFYKFSSVIGHCTYTTYCSTGNDTVTNIQSTVLYQDRCNRSTTFIQSCFNDSTFRGSVRIGFQFFHISNQHYHFQKLLNTFSSQC